jgi:hypothetical protein
MSEQETRKRIKQNIEQLTKESERLNGVKEITEEDISLLINLNTIIGEEVQKFKIIMEKSKNSKSKSKSKSKGGKRTRNRTHTRKH